jgi:hypothetical protein
VLDGATGPRSLARGRCLEEKEPKLKNFAKDDVRELEQRRLDE